MTTKDEVRSTVEALRTERALKLALEALEDYVEEYGPHEKDSGAAYAITTIRVALASKSEAMNAPLAQERSSVEQPAQQQEPVATMWQHGETGRTRITMPGDITDCDARWFKVSDLYTSPQPRKPWVRLSTDEIYDMYNEPRSDAEMVEFARAIEAKLREKNT